MSPGAPKCPQPTRGTAWQQERVTDEHQAPAEVRAAVFHSVTVSDTEAVLVAEKIDGVLQVS